MLLYCGATRREQLEDWAARILKDNNATFRIRCSPQVLSAHNLPKILRCHA